MWQITIQLFDLPPRTVRVNPYTLWTYTAPALHATNLNNPHHYPMYEAVAAYLRPRRVLEVGVRFGYSLASLLRPSEAQGTGIDNWSYPNPFDAPMADVARQNVLDVAGREPTLLAGDSREVKLTGTYDIVHIDGDHSEDGAAADIRRFWEHVEPGGVMLVDDLDDERVLRAFRRFALGRETAFLPTAHGMGLLRRAW